MISLFAPLFKNNKKKLLTLLSFIRKSKKIGIIKLSKTGEELRIGKNLFVFIFKPKFEDTRHFIMSNLNIQRNVDNNDFNTFIQDVYSLFLLRKYDLSLNNIPKKSFVHSLRNNGITKEALIEELSKRLIRYVRNSRSSTILIERRYEIITMNDIKKAVIFNPEILNVAFRDNNTLRAPPLKSIFRTLKKEAA